MKNCALFFLLAIAFVATGCISIHNNKGASSNMPVASVAPAYYQAITEIGNAPVSAEVTGHAILKFFKFGLPNTFADNGGFSDGASSSLPLPIPLPIGGYDPYKAFKEAAVYRACEDNQCDSLIDARYVITNEDYVVYQKITCKVIGTPVKITGYKEIEKK